MPDRTAAHFISRRRFLHFGLAGMPLMNLAGLGRANMPGATPIAPRAKSCIILFSWGGMSHIDTWDPKPEAGTEVRGKFLPISTSVPGIHVSQHLPGIAKRAHHLAIVRSMHHKAADHREAAYWNLTGHRPLRLGVAAVPPSRQDWPSLGAMVAKAKDSASSSGAAPESLPRTISLPYPIADRGLLNGQYSGFLGSRYEPVYLKPSAGIPYDGVSPEAGNINLQLPDGVERERFSARRSLLGQLESKQEFLPGDPVRSSSRLREQAMNMLLDPSVRSAFELEQEPAALRAAYGDHICGQSTLMARRLTESGVPLVTVYCAAGDLNGSVGAHWDTHGDNFNRLKNQLLPPLDQASSALLDDLEARGTLQDTLVVWLTEFGRTPQISGGAGRDHFPGCYSIAFAGGGIQGGQVYGSSDRIGFAPASAPCSPADLHATVFRALGVDPQLVVHDMDGRPLQLCSGTSLPLF